MANCLECKMAGLRITKPSRQVMLPPNMLALIAKSLSPRTAAALAKTGRTGRFAAARRLAQLKRLRMGYRSMSGRKRVRSPTLRAAPRGAPPTKKARR